MGLKPVLGNFAARDFAAGKFAAGKFAAWKFCLVNFFSLEKIKLNNYSPIFTFSDPLLFFYLCYYYCESSTVYIKSHLQHSLFFSYFQFLWWFTSCKLHILVKSRSHATSRTAVWRCSLFWLDVCWKFWAFEAHAARPHAFEIHG